MTGIVTVTHAPLGGQPPWAIFFESSFVGEGGVTGRRPPRGFGERGLRGGLGNLDELLNSRSRVTLLSLFLSYPKRPAGAPRCVCDQAAHLSQRGQGVPLQEQRLPGQRVTEQVDEAVAGDTDDLGLQQPDQAIDAGRAALEPEF